MKQRVRSYLRTILMVGIAAAVPTVAMTQIFPCRTQDLNAPFLEDTLSVTYGCFQYGNGSSGADQVCAGFPDDC